MQGRPEILRFAVRDGAIREIHQLIVERLRVLERGTDLDRSIILQGYLGNRPDIRQTKERTFTATWYNRLVDEKESYDVRTRAREYMVLSLYTHGDRQTQRHRLVVWSSDHLCHRNIRFMRQGDLVKVLGRPEVYSFQAGDGTTREVRQIIVERMRVLKRKHRSPEMP